MGGYGHRERDQLTRFFAKFAGLRVNGVQHLVSANCVRTQLGQISNRCSKLFLIFIPINYHVADVLREVRSIAPSSRMRGYLFWVTRTHTRATTFPPSPNSGLRTQYDMFLVHINWEEASS